MNHLSPDCPLPADRMSDLCYAALLMASTQIQVSCDGCTKTCTRCLFGWPIDQDQRHAQSCPVGQILVMLRAVAAESHEAYGFPAGRRVLLRNLLREFFPTSPTKGDPADHAQTRANEPGGAAVEERPRAPYTIHRIWVDGKELNFLPLAPNQVEGRPERTIEYFAVDLDTGAALPLPAQAIRAARVAERRTACSFSLSPLDVIMLGESMRPLHHDEICSGAFQEPRR